MCTVNGNPSSKCYGFTLAEVLAAMLFVAILIPAVVRGLTLANRAAVVAERSDTAVHLAEKRLNELLLNDEWVSAGTSGDFGEAYPLYRWELLRGTWREDDMNELTLRVLFPVQGRDYDVVLMMNGELDPIFPLETSARPLFETLGTPDSLKRHAVEEGGHILRLESVISQALAWFDRHLGPVR